MYIDGSGPLLQKKKGQIYDKRKNVVGPSTLMLAHQGAGMGRMSDRPAVASHKREVSSWTTGTVSPTD